MRPRGRLCGAVHSLTPIKNEIPRVAGQYYEYIVKQMQDFKNGRRTNDAGTMTSVSKTLSDADIDDLAHYLAALY
jgi:cytochrome c553